MYLGCPVVSPGCDHRVCWEVRDLGNNQWHRNEIGCILYGLPDSAMVWVVIADTVSQYQVWLIGANFSNDLVS